MVVILPFKLDSFALQHFALLFMLKIPLVHKEIEIANFLEIHVFLEFVTV